MRKTTYTLFFSLIIGIIISITSYKQANLDFEKNIKSQSESYNKSDTHKNKTFTISEMLYCNSKNRNVKYDHPISGKDENGQEVKGIINLETEIGIGIVKKDDDTKDIEIISEQIKSNRIIATDMNGFIYRLKLDDE